RLGSQPPFALSSSAPALSSRPFGPARRWRASRGQRCVEAGYSEPVTRSRGALAELHGDVRIPVGRDRPGRRDVVIWADDVRVMLGASPEHRVELRVVDPSTPVTNVLTGLVAEAAAEIDRGTIRVVGRNPALPREPDRVGHRDVVQA